MGRRVYRRLAICSVGGANAAKDATRANIEATNTWAFYQANNIRRTSTNLAADELELFLSAQPGMPAPARQAIATKVNQYRAEVERLTKDPEKGEGVEQLFQKAKAIEAERDVALRKDPYFDWSQALPQIGIVLASVHLIIGKHDAAGTKRRARGARRAADDQRLHTCYLATVPRLGCATWRCLGQARQTRQATLR